MNSSSIPKPTIVVLGDSTFDNKTWVSLFGVYGNAIWDLFHLPRLSSEKRIALSKYIPKPLSVAENLMASLPEYDIQDCTNDGFTTADVLRGQWRDKVFGKGVLKQFPHAFYHPLLENEEKIQNAEQIILSVGGNDFREFLMAAKDADDVDAYIRQNYDAVFTKLQTNYEAIVTKLRELNPTAPIILMTQYYPSFSQNNYGIYDFMARIGKVKNIGVNPSRGEDVIHEIIKRTYDGILESCRKHNVVIADINSSLNPFDAANHACQIEPSDVGGQKIAKMLTYMIKMAKNPGKVTQFLPGFFSSNASSQDVVHTDFARWTHKHPHEFTNVACYDPIPALTLLAQTRGESALTPDEFDSVISDENLRLALIMLKTVNPALVTIENFRKLKENIDLQKVIAAAHRYYHSGASTSFFSTHGSYGLEETKKLVLSAISSSTPTKDVLKSYVCEWLASSNVNNSSRFCYAFRFSGLFDDSNIVINYAAIDENGRRMLLDNFMEKNGYKRR